MKQTKPAPALVFPQAPPSIFRLPSPSSVVLLLLPAGASSSSFLLRFITLNFSELLKLSREYQILLLAGASSSLHLPSSVVLLLLQKSPLCRATRETLSVEFAPICVTKRDLALSLTAALFLPLAGNAAILEADDDEELLERVKKDR
ncbi:hypothetical protein V2J09_022215 [Rumex salicifolius]